MLNRYIENNPILNGEPQQTTAIARPGMKKFIEVGDGPIRKLFYAPGIFSDDLFVVSGVQLWRVSSGSGTASLIGNLSSNILGDVSMATVASIGEVPSRLFIADGGILWVYSENGNAIASLQASGAIADGDTVVIDGVYYEFDGTDVNAGTPAGTVGSPWLVDFTGDNATDLGNLYNAINASGEPGVNYSLDLTEHETVRAGAYSSDILFVNAKTAGAAGNAIAVSETGANLAWTAGTLSGGGTEQLRQIQMPGDVGAISVEHINSFIIVVPVQDDAEQTVGQFYWIHPGEVYVDELDFANAERSSDKVHQVKAFKNMFWLFGQQSTEPWITTTDPDAPMQRFQSVMFDRGSTEGAAIRIRDKLVVIDEEYTVFLIADGQQEISRPDIAERIRLAGQEMGAA
jgi:hypothetical protein